jgi:hypothetical protein
VGGAAAEVVVALGAGRLEHDLHLPGCAAEVEHRLATQVGVEREGLPIGAAGVEVVERKAETSQVLLARGGDNVDAVGEFVAPEDHPSQRTDDHVADAALVECLQDRDRVERVTPARSGSCACLEHRVQPLLRRAEQPLLETRVVAWVDLVSITTIDPASYR